MTQRTRPVAKPFTALFVSGLSILGAANSAAASTLTNADQVPRTVTIISGTANEAKSIAAGGLLQDLCPKGCVIRIDDDPKRDFILEGGERVTIEDGLLYYDGEQSKPVQPRKP